MLCTTKASAKEEVICLLFSFVLFSHLMGLSHCILKSILLSDSTLKMLFLFSKSIKRKTHTTYQKMIEKVSFTFAAISFLIPLMLLFCPLGQEKIGSTKAISGFATTLRRVQRHPTHFSTLKKAQKSILG